MLSSQTVYVLKPLHLKTPKWEKILMRLVYDLTANDIFGQFFCFLSAYLDALQLRQCGTG